MKKLITICLMVGLFVCGSIVFASPKNVSEPNMPVYDYTADANIPIALKQEIEHLITALDTNDVNEYLAGYPLKAIYDLLTGNVTLCELPDMFCDLSIREIREKQSRLKSMNITTFEKFKSFSRKTSTELFQLSDNIRKFKITSVSVDKLNSFAITNINYQNKSWRDPDQVEWIYFENKWWHNLEN